MLLVSGTASALLLVQSFHQTADVRVARARDQVARACRDIAERYQFFVSGWAGAAIDDQLRGELATVVGAALTHAVGVEGGIWDAGAGSLAYAFPTYEGTGPKTDVPAAEQNTIRDVNAQSLQSGRPAGIRQQGRSQVLLVEACPLRGPLDHVTAWTMTRVSTAEGPGYTQLLAGLILLALTIFGSAFWLARLLFAWSRNIARLETTLAESGDGVGDLPMLPRTGEQELDRLVDAINQARERLARERARATRSERLAAVGRLSAGLAHEIRNPIAAMRLKAENALASDDPARKAGALEIILQQVARLDALLRDLLDMTNAGEPKLAEIELARFLTATLETHRELAAAKNVTLTLGTSNDDHPLACFDRFQMQRALDNLILNAIQNTPPGGRVTLDAVRQGDALRLRVTDTGTGVAAELRERLFEPFITARADGTGLGLAIVREIARAHGGEARLVASDHPTTFEIELPWRPS